MLILCNLIADNYMTVDTITTPNHCTKGTFLSKLRKIYTLIKVPLTIEFFSGMLTLS